MVPTTINGYAVVAWFRTRPERAVIVIDRGEKRTPDRFVVGDHDDGAEHWWNSDYFPTYHEAIADAVKVVRGRGGPT